MDSYDQLHVISDLHFGGQKGRQIFNQGPALAAVIDHLGALDPALRVGLVINGDVIDFLADAEDGRYFNPLHAVTTLEDILIDPAFRPVFEALARFVHADNRTLVLAMGNHDVELGLRDVEARLLQALGGDDLRARARIQYVMDGAGYLCLVGGDKVLAVHGNETDAWNPIDYEALRRTVRALNRGAPTDAWNPNAGTRLVVDVMNGIKKRYPFVDLLKPETIAVPQLLLALPTDYKASLMGFARSVGREVFDDGRKYFGLLSAGDGDDGRQALDALISKGPLPRAARLAPIDEDPLAAAAGHLAAGTRPIDLLDAAQAKETLGLGGLLLDRLFGRDPRENLREALVTYMGDDQTFSLGGKDEVFDALDKDVASDVRFIIAGHTHLERRLLRKRGSGVYYNSGTWIRLIRLSESMLRTRESFAPLYDALMSEDMNDLDRATSVDGQERLVLQRGTMVSIESTGSGARAELRHAALAPGESLPAAPAPPWRSVPGSQYP